MAMSRDGGVYDRDLDKPYRAPVADARPAKAPAGEYVGYGGFWRRVAAYILDGILLGIVGAVIGGVAGVMMMSGAIDPNELGPQLMLNFLGVSLNVLYNATMESSGTQATLGKMAMGMKVTNLYGQRITFINALGRELAKILSGLILGIGYIMAAFDERKQGLHDKIAKTLVLRTR